MTNLFKSRKIGRTGQVAQIFNLAVGRGYVVSKVIPEKNVMILKSMYIPGYPIMYRVAYPVQHKESVWDIADVSGKELTPLCKPLPTNIGDF